MLWIWGLQIPWFDRSNLFYDGFQIRRDAWRGMGRLAGYGRLAGCGTASGVCWTHSEGVGCLAGGDERHIR